PEILGDRVQFGQLFFNLISNSLKFSDVAPVISVSAEVVKKQKIKNPPKKLVYEKYHKIIVEDNGIGFEEQYRDLIFSLFQRLHDKQSSYQGTGIGLALCKKVVENHNGFITAESEGKGATFTVYLPVI